MASDNNNLGEQLRSAVQNAIESQDFSTLRNTFQQTLNSAADGISRGIAQMQEGARAAQAEHQMRLARQREEELQRQKLAEVQYRYTKTGGMRAGGIAMSIAGGGFALSCLGSAAATGASAALIGGTGSAILGAGTGGLLVFGIAFALMFALGLKKATFAGRFNTYKSILGTREYCSVSELATASGKREEAVAKDLRKMISKGMFTQGHLSKDGSILMVTNEAWAHYERALQKQSELERERMLAQTVQPKTPPQAQLTPEQKSLLEMGDAYVAKIRASNRAIPDAAVTAKINQIELVVNRIFEHAEEHPEVIDDLQRLMDYYLPTTVKLLDAYADLDSQPIQGENITASKREIEETLDTLSVAFEKLLDSIFRDMTWDVSTDISVLHTVLAQEGLVDGAFDNSKTGHGQDGT